MQFEGVVGATGAGAELAFGVTSGVFMVALLVGGMAVLLVGDTDLPDADLPDADLPDADLPDAEFADAELPGAVLRVAFDGGRVVVVLVASVWIPWRRPAAGGVEVVGERTGMVGMVVVGTVGRVTRLAGGVTVGGGRLMGIVRVVVGATEVGGTGTSVVVGATGSVVVVGVAGTVVVDAPALVSAPTVDPTADGSVDPRPELLPAPGLLPGAAWAEIPTRLPGVPNRATTETAVKAVVAAVTMPTLDRQNPVPAWYLPLM